MLESYLSNHSDAQFSHGTCPECLEKELDKIRCIHSKSLIKWAIGSQGCFLTA